MIYYHCLHVLNKDNLLNCPSHLKPSSLCPRNCICKFELMFCRLSFELPAVKFQYQRCKFLGVKNT